LYNLPMRHPPSPTAIPPARAGLWLPAVVALLGAGMALGGWGLLVVDRRQRLLEASAEAGAGLRSTVEATLGRQVQTLSGLRDQWRAFGLPSPDEWQGQADREVDGLPGLRALAWRSQDGSRSRVAAAPGTDLPDGGLGGATARGTGERIEGPDRTASGKPGYSIVLPLAAAGGPAGVVIGRFDAEVVLTTALRARATGHALSLHWDGEAIHRRGTPSSDPWQDWWRVEERVELPLPVARGPDERARGHWRLVLRPTPAFAAAQLTPVPHYLLAAGLLVSLLLAVMTHQLRIIVRQSRFLEATNRALEERGVELESGLAEKAAALEDAVEELEAFNFSVSHDLRTPLGAILNFAAILEEDYRDKPIDDEGAALLARIQRSATRATNLLNDLLELSRAGRSSLSLERLDMASLCHEILAQVRAVHEDARVELVVGDLPEAWGDRTLIGTVLANLFSNSIKYARPDTATRIEVRGHETADETCFEVSDDGQGFDMRFAGKLFRLFERLHGGEIDGSGVGLAIVARIVRRHGGRVWAEGEPDRGATFGFALPRAVDP